jgi:hypothetical protein
MAVLYRSMKTACARGGRWDSDEWEKQAKIRSRVEKVVTRQGTRSSKGGSVVRRKEWRVDCSIGQVRSDEDGQVAVAKRCVQIVVAHSRVLVGRGTASMRGGCRISGDASQSAKCTWAAACPDVEHG